MDFDQYADIDEEKIFDEIEFKKFLSIVNEIAPLAHDFRKDQGQFDYGPRPESLKGNTSGKAKLVQTSEFKYYGEVSNSISELPHGKGIKLVLRNKTIEEAWYT